MERNIIYKLADGRMWDTQKAVFITEAPDDANIMELKSASGESDNNYLAKTLAFYDFQLGELACYSAKGIKEELARLDAEYLTPRTLAGLSANDPEALGRYQLHENQAKPLREKLAALTADGAEQNAIRA